MSQTLIFDIGKTNKKIFLFDENFEVIFQSNYQPEEILDDDNFPCDDIETISKWVIDNVNLLINDEKYNVKKINFSCYGATLVHLRDDKTIVTPMYNYLKPLTKNTFAPLYKNYNGKKSFVKRTSSPALDLLNSGLQLYWLKYHKTDFLKDIKHSVHFPNYLAFLLHGQLQSEYTSIGCHTALWDFKLSKYHKWLSDENLIELLPKLTNGNKLYPYLADEVQDFPEIMVGTGLHDSSAALIPYIKGNEEPFALLSTGTWNIFINPSYQGPLSRGQLEQDCLSFLTTDGNPVVASRLLFGSNHDALLELMIKEYNYEGDFKTISFNENIYESIRGGDQTHFFSVHPESGRLIASNNMMLLDFEVIYHYLIYQMVVDQSQKIKLIMKDSTDVKTIYIDGGFAKNNLFCQMLKEEFPGYNWKTSQLAAGSSLGAAIAVNEDKYNSHLFNKILNIEEV